MSLNHLLLGIARNGAMGYQIKKNFEEGLQHIWNAELSQIYPALQRLEEKGYLSSQIVSGERGAAKRVYNLSPTGATELHRWLRSDPKMHDERHPFLAQLALMGDLNDLGQTLAYFRALESIGVARLHTLEHLASTWQRTDAAYPDLADDQDFHVQMTLEFGLSNARAMLQCCRACIDRVELRIQAKTPTAD